MARQLARRVLKTVAGVGLGVLLLAPASASAQSAPSLGAAQTFAVLGASTVTNTGGSVITGELGVSPGTAVTGFPPGVVLNGTIHSADGAASAAQSAVTTAYNDLAGQACNQILTGQDLGGMTLFPGVYCFASSAQLTGTLTLNAGGDANAVFIFQIGSTLTTATNAVVNVINNGSACNVFWQVGSSATLGVGTALAGNILALASITVTTGASITGRAFARTGAVTLDSNTVSGPCAAAPVCPTVAIAPLSLANGTVGVAYSQTLSGSGGATPYSFAVTAGTLPTGLTLTSDGVLSGTPTAVGTFTFTIRMADANGCFASVSYTIVVAPAPPVCQAITLSPSTLLGGTVAVAYTQTFTGSGGATPFGFDVSAGALPPGLTLTSAGVLAGTPTADGSFTFTIRATDANACVGSLAYTIVIEAAPPPPPVCPTITLTPSTLPGGTVAVAYTQTLAGNGGATPFGFDVSAGALPPGLTLTPEGVLAGTPTAAGTFNFTIRATDANACVGSLAYTIVIAAAPPPPPVCPTITLAPVTLPSATVGVPYSQAISGSGGSAPYGFGITSGTLPAGLILTAEGLLSGTPTTPGTATFTIRGTDANACFAELSFSVVIPSPVPTLSGVLVLLLTAGIVGFGYYRLRWRVSAR